MKTRLGLDIGTNSIGWALIENDFDNKEGSILGLGSRIIPMTADVIGAFEGGGVIETSAAQRTSKRLMRRMYQRSQLRRERLLRVLNTIGYLPPHFAAGIDFEGRKGQFKNGPKPLLAYADTDNGGKPTFLFKESFEEMVNEFKRHGHLEKVPYDWTLYYLRKKALHEMIGKHELAWLLLHFNQKRGYYQSREEVVEQDNSKREEYLKCKIMDVIKTDDKKGTQFWFEMTLDNGLVYKRAGDDRLLDWKGMEREFILTTQLDSEGNPAKNKDGGVKYSFRAPGEQDWGLMKIRSESEVDAFNAANGTIGTGAYIFNALLGNPDQKVIGGLIRTVERKYYRDELTKILQNQANFHPELRSKEVFEQCAMELYPSNEVHRSSLLRKNLSHLIIDDILFYHRPLKSKKTEVSDCQFESRAFTDEDGKLIHRPIKAAPKSHPLFEEFRVLQFLHNLRLYRKDFEDKNSQGGLVDITKPVLGSLDMRESLLEWMLSEERIDQETFLKYLVQSKLITKKDKENCRWNYAEENFYPLAPARAQMLSRLKRAGLDPDWLTEERQLNLWHIIYSVKDLIMYRKALRTFSAKNSIDAEAFITAFQSHKPYESAYCAYSVKALNKLVPLMRFGKRWSATKIEADLAQKLKSLEPDIKQFLAMQNQDKSKQPQETMQGSENHRAMVKSLASIDPSQPIQGLNTYQACYAVYGRHSESTDAAFWERPEDIDHYLSEFKAMSLRNPIVEQVILETLRLVRDIWRKYGHGKTNFFDEIHVELGRDLKKPKAEREKISKRTQNNEATNLRIRALLSELSQDPSVDGDVKPYSPSQQEILKLYEEGALANGEVPEDIEKISRTANPSKNDIQRYKLWLEQRYLSPYTGQIIPLSKLFTTAYQIEHVIPKARYFDDSLSNKVICESAVNTEKKQQTGLEFIKNNSGSVIDLGQGKMVKLLTEDVYRATCQRIFGHNPKKLSHLLSEDIPEGFINRQLNDTRYVSRFVMGLLSNIVRNPDETSFRVARLVPMSGSITSEMKRDWGLNDVWNRLIQPRFERLNKLTNSNDFGYFDSSINAFRIQVPEAFRKGFTAKRIDHRHHALDALVIASVTSDHINYLNSLNSLRNNESLRKKLLTIEKTEFVNTATGEISTSNSKRFSKPWPSFTQDAHTALEGVVISSKVRHRVINRTTNKYWSYTDENGKPYADKAGRPVKKLTPQVKGEAWAIRRQMHNDGVSGKVRLRRVSEKPVAIAKAALDWQNIAERHVRMAIKELLVKKFNNDSEALSKHIKKNGLMVNDHKVENVRMHHEFEATVKRVQLNSDFSDKQLEKLTDTGVQKILRNHVKRYPLGNDKFDFEAAFSQEGLAAMNSDIKRLNDGKDHKPIKAVREYEVSQRFQVGPSPDSNHKYVEAAKGSNLFFAVYQVDENGKRDYETLPLNEVIEHQKQVANQKGRSTSPVPIRPEKGQLLFVLSPGDLVYNPTLEEIQTRRLPDLTSLSKTTSDRIYRMEKATGKQCYFINHNIASLIAPYNAGMQFGEFKSQGKFEGAEDDLETIKATCIKLRIDSLGTIIGYEGW